MSYGLAIESNTKTCLNNSSVEIFAEMGIRIPLVKKFRRRHDM
jgi:hypothetical protein